MTRMPFGRFRGRAISDLPDDYPAWLMTIELWPPLRAAVEAECLARGARAAGDADEDAGLDGSSPLPADVREIAQDLVAAGYRVLAKRHHPTEAAEALRAYLRGVATEQPIGAPS